ncbi:MULTISPECIES: ATP-dependent zinc protease family protein [Pseudomonas]|uniref:Uncharacterized conserved protein n=1 Tax=Pseudomonas delhiensis TaxID=366289 RepID=A0A239LFD6_9PSED|nr:MULTISPECIES: RimK/LysX family protein [Pseudomonas]PWU28106.1 ATP-dependent zinc protease [Pseudomonas sp. RW407]SDJ25752.1 Uncharacterized conserved protein [Pseudomonas delhiensis]SNT29010.1 Uncharacterized conserved protein [Pseudomonas delhiensis]
MKLRLAGLLLAFSCPSLLAAQPATWGWVEQARLMPENVLLKVRLDTGVQTSVMDARNLVRIRKNEQRWVQYDILVKDVASGQVQRLPFERPIERTLKVRGANGIEHRPVVSMDLCLGDKVYREQFALTDREGSDYPVLLGRRSLEHLGAVDVSKTLTTPPTCKP